MGTAARDAERVKAVGGRREETRHSFLPRGALGRRPLLALLLSRRLTVSQPLQHVGHGMRSAWRTHLHTHTHTHRTGREERGGDSLSLSEFASLAKRAGRENFSTLSLSIRPRLSPLRREGRATLARLQPSQKPVASRTRSTQKNGPGKGRHLLQGRTARTHRRGHRLVHELHLHPRRRAHGALSRDDGERERERERERALRGSRRRREGACARGLRDGERPPGERRDAPARALGGLGDRDPPCLSHARPALSRARTHARTPFSSHGRRDALVAAVVCGTTHTHTHTRHALTPIHPSIFTNRLKKNPTRTGP